MTNPQDGRGQQAVPVDTTNLTQTPKDLITDERPARTLSGIPVLAALVLVTLVGIGLAINGAALLDQERTLAGVASVAAGVIIGGLSMFGITGLFMLEPNESAVLTLFGAYRGTAREPGLRWANPFYGEQKVSLRIRNFETTDSKVNDANGNPIEVSAVVVWRVTDTARAVFHVDEFERYVEIQAEAAVRHMARMYPYDSFLDVGEDGEAEITLSGNADEVSEALLVELVERMKGSGVEIIEARIRDLAYAAEVAESMLRRQQAAAVVAARRLIVKGAVDMVRDAVELLEKGDEENDPIPMDTDRKATFASNLMTVIASDQPTNPVVNVGTLHR